MNSPEETRNILLEFIRLEAAARSAESVQNLSFVVANETHRLVPYRQAFVCTRSQLSSRYRLTTASGLATVDSSTPFYDWFQSLVDHLEQVIREQPDNAPYQLNCDEAPDTLRRDWHEWLPGHLTAVPLADRAGATTALLILVREAPFHDSELETLNTLSQVYAHAYSTLTPPKGMLSCLSRRFRSRRTLLSLAGLAVATLFVPVRQSSLGSAEVTPLTYTSVTAPMDGIIASIAVKANDAVAAGDLLFRLDNTSVRNRLESARRSLGVARSEEFTSRQKAFSDQQSRSEVATQAARVQERGSTIVYMSELLEKSDIKSPVAGIALFGDPVDWEGKPVSAGERIMMVAAPESAGLTIWIPAADAINLEKGAKVRMFLSTSPLAPLAATVARSSYQPQLSPDGIASYRVTALFDKTVTLPRLGLRGTAKVYGTRVCLAYYLFRRPWAAIRQYVGL